MSFFSPAPARPVSFSPEEIGRRFRFIRIRQVSIMLLGYALFYVCRLAFSATKKTMIEQGAYTSREIGYVGSAMLMVIWFVNGFAQASGSQCCVVSLARWWPNRSRGTFYGIWSCSNNLGEAIAYIVTSVIMVKVASLWGADMAWRSGFWGAATFDFIGAVLISLFMRD